MGTKVLALDASHPLSHAIQMHREQPDTIPIVHEAGKPIGLLRKACRTIDPAGPESHLPCKNFVERASFVQVNTLQDAARLALESKAQFLIVLDETGTNVIADLDRTALVELVAQFDAAPQEAASVIGRSTRDDDELREEAELQQQYARAAMFSALGQ